MDKVECVVIGAGVIGLAIARALAQMGKEVLMLESERAIGCGISSRNSEVIHGGIYYPHDSLKAKLCVQGRKELVSYARDRSIPHQLCGKLIVATQEAQLATLKALQNQAVLNGLGQDLNDGDGLQWMDQSAVKQFEPEVRCLAALYSPATGIIDSHTLMLNLLGDAQDSGAMVALGARVMGGRGTDSGVELDIAQTEPTLSTSTIIAEKVINAAGLGAVSVSKSISGQPLQSIPDIRFAKGNYFKLNQSHHLSRLVYPLPEPGGLGVHLTIGLDGRVRCGPDVQWVDERYHDALDYDVDEKRRGDFFQSVQKYYPGVLEHALQADYAGFRPKIYFGDTPYGDFLISTEKRHGVGGLVHLYGFESPGLTASLAIARLVGRYIESEE